MKRIISFLLAPAFLMLACKGGGKDSVQKADSANETHTDTSGSQGLTATDQASAAFLVEAANGGMAEIKMGEMARQKAGSMEVSDFGTLMVKDHTAANETVKALAAQKNITLPATVSDVEQQMIDKLLQKNGKDFDKAYVDIMVEDHQEDVAKFEKAAANLGDADIKAFAAASLPFLKTHLDKIRMIRDNMK